MAPKSFFRQTLRKVYIGWKLIERFLKLHESNAAVNSQQKNRRGEETNQEYLFHAVCLILELK